MDEACRIRAASSADIGAVAAIEAGAFSDPWSPAAFRTYLDHLFLVADADGAVLGYLVAWASGSEAEILNLAVRPTARRRGVGRILLWDALGRLAAAGVSSVFLEVRPSNVAARALYAGAGFREVGIRRGYYRAPPEDALVLRRDGGGAA
jgi:ribosomal-protein-alanine N-acetyltransferase